ncbi:hypothetical protein ACLB2K_029886 [Fragaria x ananassa]
MNKRGKEEEQTLDLVNYLMLLSKVDQNYNSSIKKQKNVDRVFVCKTCNREFSLFQALGGHRASHMKPGGADQLQLAQPSSSAKTKLEACVSNLRDIICSWASAWAVAEPGFEKPGGQTD